jgi:hypothetical protein
VGGRLIVMAVVAALVTACAAANGPRDGSGTSPAPDTARFTSRLPLLTALPDVASLIYRAPAAQGLFYDDGRWSECGHYPEVGDPSGVSLQAEYDSPPQAALPVYFVRLRPAGREAVASVLSAWIKKCGEQFSVDGQDYVAKLETDDADMPPGTSLLTVTNTKHKGMAGDWFFGPPSVQIAATESDGVAFEAWVVTLDQERQENQLGAMVRSFQTHPVPFPDMPVAEWTPAQLSRLFMIPGQTDGHIDIAVPSSEDDDPRTEPSPEQVCEDDPLRASEYAGVPQGDQPTGVDALMKYGGSYPADGPGAPVTVVYREHPGVDSVARMQEWTSTCTTRTAPLPAVCVGSDLKPEFIPISTTIEGEQAVGYRRYDPDESSGGHGAHPSCIGKAQAALTVRVAGLLICTEMAIDATKGYPDWSAAVRPLEAQVADVIRVIHSAG